SWNGTTWTTTASPNKNTNNNVLNAVTCVSSLACNAVGYASTGTVLQTLIEPFGSIWSLSQGVSPASGYNVLNSVSCVSSIACRPVGYFTNGGYRTPLIESWNGTAWTQDTSPSFQGHDIQLYSVSCVSATSCKAVGSYDGGDGPVTLIESWNGTTWSYVGSPNNGTENDDNVLTGVSCVSTTSCTAVRYCRVGG